jgi:hypothetical protein
MLFEYISLLDIFIKIPKKSKKNPPKNPDTLA